MMFDGGERKFAGKVEENHILFSEVHTILLSDRSSQERMDQFQLNTILWSSCVGIAVILLGYCVYTYVRTDTPTITHKLLVAASAVFVLKTVTALVYGVIMWLPPGPRYVGVYLFLNAPHVMLFYLYEVRLYIFVSKQIPESAVNGIRVFMYCLIGLFATNTLVLTTLGVVYATNKPDGSYDSSGTGFYEVKIINYAIELTICFFILLGTFVSTNQRFFQMKSARLNASDFLYRVILTSDTTIFFVVFVIVIYKALTTFKFNTSGSIGLLPFGNLGFQHLIDAIQYTLMVINLLIPAALYRSKVSGKSTSRSRTGSRTASSSAKEPTSSAVSRGHAIETHIPLDEVFSLGEKKPSGDDVSVKTTTQLLRNPSFGTGKNNRLEDSGLLSQSTQLQMVTYNQARQDLLGNGGGVLGGYNNNSNTSVYNPDAQFNQFPKPPVQFGTNTNNSTTSLFNPDAAQFNGPKPPNTFVDVNRVPTPFNQQGNAPPYSPTGTGTKYPIPPYSPSRAEPNFSQMPYSPTRSDTNFTQSPYSTTRGDTNYEQPPYSPTGAGPNTSQDQTRGRVQYAQQGVVNPKISQVTYDRV
ncbi:hypothetical protein BJ742DRAFT_512288 [Cladochytrium replicatum]|nr:hypothetical protein BJ742DRAFT_512288 [Cladochytrium replicatum]